MAHHGRKDWDRAIADFSTFIDRVPDFAPAYIGRAASYENRGDLALALADVEQALRLEPNNTGLYYLPGVGPRPAGGMGSGDRRLHPAPARRAGQRRHAGRSRHDQGAGRPVRRGRGRLRGGAGAFGAAPLVPVRRARYLYAAQGDYDRAVADCDRIIQIDPNFAEAYLHRGLALLARGEPGRAVKDFDRVLALNQPDAMTFEGRLSTRYAELYQARGDARAQLGDAAGAKADHDQAARLRAGEIEALFRLRRALPARANITRWSLTPTLG